MKSLLRKFLIISQAIALVLLLSLRAIAGQPWAGAGKIISGPGQGASVTLVIDIDGSVVTIKEGPSPNEKVNWPSGKTNAGQWSFNQSGTEIHVMLYTTIQQTVFYRLSPSN
jgi:hypothetical protein